MLYLCLVIQRCLRGTPFAFCLYFRVIVNEKPLNLEKTTSSVLSLLLLIYVSDNHMKICLEIYESEGNMEEDENKDEKIRMEKDGQIEEMERVLRKEGEKEEEEEKRSLRSLLFRKMMLKKIVN